MAIFRIRNVSARVTESGRRLKNRSRFVWGPTYADIRMYGIRVSSSRN